ncbi:MAG: WbqC family protein [Bacteroidales bacterium]|nr:WbqC family protein [Bacteroidales bacterium]
MENASNHKLLLSSSYFPTLEYFVNFLRYEKVLIDVHETYPKQTWRNRCRILSANGLMDLTIPVEKPNGNRTKTSEVVISSHSSWQKNHWRSIESAYRNAPFYIYYKDLIENLIMDRKITSLHLFNHQILNNILEELGVKKTVEFTRSFIHNSEGFTDRRFSISPKAKDRRIGKEMAFEPYYQVFADKFGFKPNLSILDLLFNSGPDTLKYLQNSAKE